MVRQRTLNQRVLGSESLPAEDLLSKSPLGGETRPLTRSPLRVRMTGAQRGKSPGVLGHITNNLIYKRLPPGVLEDLRRMIGCDEKGRLKRNLFQGLTPDVGHPKLRELLAGKSCSRSILQTWKSSTNRRSRISPIW